VIRPSADGSGSKATPQFLEIPGGEGKIYRVQTDKQPGAAQGTEKNVYNYATTTKQGGGQNVTLSRATYKLNKDQAAALGTLLGSIKATVMETKVDGETVTVTTTPEVQSAIAQIVRLVQGQTGGTTSQYRFNVTPATPATPVEPVEPVKPVKPAKPAKPAETPSLFVPGSVELDKDALKRHIEVELKQLDLLKNVPNLKDLNIDVKALEGLKDLKIDVKSLDEMKKIEIDLSKLKELEGLKELDKLKELKLRQADVEKARQAQTADAEKRRAEGAILKARRTADVDKAKAAQKSEAERAAELEKAIKALIGEAGKKPGSEKKPEGPAK